MSGHNKWSQIKHQKGAKDQKRAALFTKILGAIAIAAKTNPRPEDNPRLRTLVEKAREASVPNENIQRAINRAKEQKDLKEFVFECVGPEGISILVEGITDNSNRSIQQLRTLAGDLGCKPADPGSLLWAFELVDELIDGVQTRHYRAKFPQPIPEDLKEQFADIVEKLDDYEDVQRVTPAAIFE
jgi:transcriptional/translational regulatory protein YebC/TACO1